MSFGAKRLQWQTMSKNCWPLFCSIKILLWTYSTAFISSLSLTIRFFCSTTALWKTALLLSEMAAHSKSPCVINFKAMPIHKHKPWASLIFLLAWHFSPSWYLPDELIGSWSMVTSVQRQGFCGSSGRMLLEHALWNTYVSTNLEEHG